ncbi:MAG: hypothetical protein EZS28_021708 [Streblomastix strix]|uniref:Uncharacterized protein n=1 Tax=Streblomastix strix TaxID=222440 RepID=A0A5J4VJH1_9EUKA|nr:MAG: hypothetical protein EZS28_021708 [Streblomastix strix]
MQQAYALYFGTGTTRTCELWIQLPAWSNAVIIEYTNSGTVTAPISNILTTPPVDELPTGYTLMITLTPNLQFDYQTINNAPFTQNGTMQINPLINGTFNEGIRISRNPINEQSNIQFGCDPNQNTGKIDNQWLAGSTGNNGANYLGFVIVKAGEEGQADRGLQISADGNTLTFNGRVL